MDISPASYLLEIPLGEPVKKMTALAASMRGKQGGEAQHDLSDEVLRYEDFRQLALDCSSGEMV